MMKKVWLCLTLLLVMPVSTGMANTVQDAGSRPVQRPTVDVMFDGQPLDTAWKGERSIMVPLRSISESIGSFVSWNPYNRTAVVSNGRMKIRFTAGSQTAYVNQTPTLLPQKAVIKEGRLLVPMVILKRLIQNNEYSIAYSNQQDMVQIVSHRAPVLMDGSSYSPAYGQGQDPASTSGYGGGTGSQPAEDKHPEKVYIPSLDSLISESK